MLNRYLNATLFAVTLTGLTWGLVFSLGSKFGFDSTGYQLLHHSVKYDLWFWLLLSYACVTITTSR